MSIDAVTLLPTDTLSRRSAKSLTATLAPGEPVLATLRGRYKSHGLALTPTRAIIVKGGIMAGLGCAICSRESACN